MLALPDTDRLPRVPIEVMLGCDEVVSVPEIELALSTLKLTAPDTDRLVSVPRDVILD